MFWKKVTIDGYIPFTHVGNHHVEVDFVSASCGILGGNGSGKSSMLRILCNPGPEIRTNYLPGGKVVKVLEHAGHIYTLTSDFSNTTAPHSFKKDDAELNLSGTSDTQRDLVEEHFGWTQLISDIMSGNMNICGMQKSMRKQLFSATYPSDLSFVLEYHKKVCSQIRTYANQIKLLQGREGSLMSSLIEESERERLKNWREAALDILSRIDKVNLLLENEIQQLQSHEVFKKDVHPEFIETTKNDLKNCLHSFRQSLMNWNESKALGEDLSADALNIKFVEFDQARNFLVDKKRTVSKNLEGIRDELDRFTRIKNAPTSDKKDELNNELLLIEKEMTELKQNPEWQNAPAIPADKMTAVNDLIPTLNDIIASLHPYAGKMVGQEVISKLRSENDAITFTNTSLITEKVGLEQQLAQQRSRKEMMTQNSYPKDCSRVCGLRATLEASVRDIDLRCAEIEARLRQIFADLEAGTKQLEANKKVLQECAPALPIMKNLWDKLSENYLIDLALNGESFIDCLNTHCVDIPNRIIKGIKSSQIYHRYKELFDRSETIKNTLTMMKSNEAVNLSIEVIDEIIQEKQTKLDAGINELDDLERKVLQAEKISMKALSVKTLVTDMEAIVLKLQDEANMLIIQNRIDFDRQVIHEHMMIKNELSTKLREIEHTLEEQKRIMDVLNTEIRPTLEDLRKQKMDWELVETGLSPTKGLPCIYLIRFMNRLISRANAIIRDIWYCDMELAYIDEKETLDFTISVILNKSTTVKDISLCSKGQSAIINLAMTLAICMERGYLDQYPLSLDEVDAALTDEHRAKLCDLLSRFIDEGIIKQMLLVNHFSMQSGLTNCDIVALSTDGIVIPGAYNEHAVIN